MPIISTAKLYDVDGHEKVFTADEICRMASCGQVGAGKEWSSAPPPPSDWKRIVPRYRVTRDVQPAEKSRFRFESPFTEIWSGAWQYGDRLYESGEEIESTAWPHPSFMPLNYSAERVLAFFKSEMKSRLTVSPWLNGQVRLDNGLSNAPIPADVKPPQVQPMNLRPVA
jgi:hypothetical protein